MKATKLIVKNIGIIADAEIEINKPLIILYGQIKQGKSTLLKAIQWVIGGPYPKDIIRHGCTEASIELHFEGGFVIRSWYFNKKKEVEDRPVKFVRDGKPVERPVTELKRFLNPFLTNQDHLISMGEADRKKFFSELFAVDTTDLDLEQVRLSTEASNLRSEIKGYGEIDLTVYQRVDTTALRTERQKKVNEVAAARAALESELSAINQAQDERLVEWNAACASVDTHNATVQRGEESLTQQEADIAELQTKLHALKIKRDQTKTWLSKNPAKAKPAKPAAPDTTKIRADIHKLHTVDTSDIDQQIQDAGSVNARADAYDKNLARSQERDRKQLQLEANEARQRQIKVDKIAKLKDVSASSGIAGLEFTEDGAFRYEGTDAGMLSTSQMMRLSTELSALYPEGLGIGLLDRGESLGRSIMDYVKHAESHKISVLATVVGERPAVVPENVGVFVVQDGVVIKD